MKVFGLDAGAVSRNGAAARLAFVALSALLAVVHGAAIITRIYEAYHPTLVLMLLEGAVYLALVWLILSRRVAVPLWALLGVALILRLPLLCLDPYHSTDIYRYVWDGRVQGANINPYLYVPIAPELSHLRDAAIYPNVNRADYAPTIYPPMAQIIFFVTTRINETAIGLKAALVAFEAVTVWAILRLLDLETLPRERVLIYAWSPLAAWEFAGSGHIDVAMTAFVALALLASRLRRDTLAGVALGAAALVKFFPIVIAPALWRRGDWRLPLALAATIILGYALYAPGAGWAVLGFLPDYAGEEGLRDGTGFWLAGLLRALTGLEPAPLFFVGAIAVVMAGLALFVVTRAPLERGSLYFPGALALAAAAMLALSPHYPWYFAWLLPLLCLVPSWPLLWLSTASFLLYWDFTRDVPWMADTVYGVTFGLLVIQAARWVRWPVLRRRIA